MTAVGGSSNPYPPSECTWWASERYHQLTGMYVPWSGNAADWKSQAPQYGWSVSSSPIVPSIICLQPGVQGASAQFGHVGVVEKVSGRTIETSNLNWQPTPGSVTTVEHTTGQGVSFLYVSGQGGVPLFQMVNLSLKQVTDQLPVKITPDSDVTSFLYGLDQLLNLVNPFEGITTTQDNLGPISFTDPVSWLEGFGQNLLGDLGALLLRGIFLFVGTLILYKTLTRFLDIDALGGNLTQLMGGFL